MAWLPADKKETRGSQAGEAQTSYVGRSTTRTSREKNYHDIKNRLHRTLVERLDTAQLEAMEEKVVALEIRRAVAQLLTEDPFPLNSDERHLLPCALSGLLGPRPLGAKASWGQDPGDNDARQTPSPNGAKEENLF